VDVVAHSMGGLVTRLALVGTANHVTSTTSGKGFPPFLYIEDVATLSTPFWGASDLGQTFCSISPDVQCNQMKPGSTFYTSWINRPGASNRVGWDNPQSAMGTDWTLIGSEDDDFMVPEESAVDLKASFHASHKLVYRAGSGLDHSQMSEITTGRGNYAARWCDLGSGCNPANWTGWPQTGVAKGPLIEAAKAVQYASAY